MERRQLAGTDLHLSEVGLGGNTFGPPRLDREQSVRTIRAALDLGVNFIDTALVYGEGQSEVFIGEAIAGRRDEVVIATKFRGDPPREGARAPSGGAIPDSPGLHAATVGERVRLQAEESLRKLGVDHIDLYQVHDVPRGEGLDEMLLALDELVRAGKVRAIGAVSNPSWRLAEAVHSARRLGTASYVSAQDYYNVLRRQIEAEVVPFCRAYGLSLIPYAPLAGGFLTGKYRPGEPPPPGSRGAAGSPLVTRSASDRNWQILPGLEAFAAERGRTLTELAVAWLLAEPLVVSVIAGASSPEQVQANVAGAGWKLTAEEKAELDALAPREGDDGAGRGARR